MTQPNYHIVPDVPGAFLRIELAGSWDEAIANRYAADVSTTVRTMLGAGLRHGELRTLIDMRHKAVVPQNVAAIFAKMVQPGSPSRRIAVIVSSALHRLQTKRVADSRFCIFADEVEALAWLEE